jgi:hypothetical protein
LKKNQTNKKLACRILLCDVVGEKNQTLNMTTLKKLSKMGYHIYMGVPIQRRVAFDTGLTPEGGSQVGRPFSAIFLFHRSISRSHVQPYSSLIPSFLKIVQISKWFEYKNWFKINKVIIRKWFKILKCSNLKMVLKIVQT